MARTALITGCSSGIGRATAERFREAGWTTYATARDIGDVRDLGDRGCRTAALDVTDDVAVEAVVGGVLEEQGRLDCVVNNAGYGQFGPVEDVPIERVVEQFDVNTFGPLRLVRAALPGMRERGRGTIINVGGAVSNLSIPGMGAYVGSKYALHSLTDTLRQEVGGTGVDVVLVQPGAVATDFYERAVAEVERADHTPAYADLYRVLDDLEVVERGGPGINRPERVADAILAAASADNPKPVYRVGSLSVLGSLFGATVRGRARNAATRTAVKGLATGPAQRLLEKRRASGDVAQRETPTNPTE